MFVQIMYNITTVTSPKKWKKYFEGLLNDRDPSSFTSHQDNFRTFDPQLDGIITKEELRGAIGDLKCGKAAGPDGIYSECLKIFGKKYEEVLLLLMQRIFSNNLYPTQWTIHYLKPIYKKGGVSDPNNFRGLAIGPALAKLFSHIMLRRLDDFIKDKKLTKPNWICQR